MNKRVSYQVSWTFGGRASESRRFDEWDPAAEFYEGVVADPRCDLANLVEVTETEARCFEREPGVTARASAFEGATRDAVTHPCPPRAVGRGSPRRTCRDTQTQRRR